jgi:hypothetical protein
MKAEQVTRTFHREHALAIPGVRRNFQALNGIFCPNLFVGSAYAAPNISIYRPLHRQDHVYSL